jgi:hypothetical protein
MPRDASENVALPNLDYETWKELVRAMGGRFNPEGIDSKAFIGWLRPMSVFGLRQPRLVLMLSESSGRGGMFASMARTTTSRSFRWPASPR